jgi:hypothetical protein
MSLIVPAPNDMTYVTMRKYQERGHSVEKEVCSYGGRTNGTEGTKDNEHSDVDRQSTAYAANHIYRKGKQINFASA